MDDVRVERWRKYGNDRLYINRPDGRRLGWCDLATGTITVEDDDDRTVVQAAVTRWHSANPAAARPSSPGPATPTRPPPPSPSAPQVDVTPASPLQEAGPPTWDDLAERRAGQAAREQATALKEAAPVRTFLARLIRIHTDERAWRIGADGEEKVGAQLAKLVKKDPRWRVLHAVPVGENGADIDHVVIGPGGVFTLNAKHHPGAKIWVAGTTFMVNGQKQPYLRNSRHEAARATRLLTAASGIPLHAVGVAVRVGAQDIVIKTAPEGTHVVHRRALTTWLGRQPEVLGPDAIDRTFEAARRSPTWLERRPTA